MHILQMEVISEKKSIYFYYNQNEKQIQEHIKEQIKEHIEEHSGQLEEAGEGHIKKQIIERNLNKQ